ncbi:DUF1963 domain-containing protein [bacterium]|nr:MAG: DUF1963 domain-containing protein [bacterium]
MGADFKSAPIFSSYTALNILFAYQISRATRSLLKKLEQIAPQPLLDRFNQFIRHTIVLQSYNNEHLNEEEREQLEITPLASTLGGIPNIPVGFKWPHCESEPLDFVAQINLNDLTPCDVDGLCSSAAKTMLRF